MKVETVGAQPQFATRGGGGREQKRGNNRGEKGVSERTQMIGRV